MTIALTAGGDISADADGIRTALGRDDIQIENKGSGFIILEADGSELSSADQTTVSALAIFS